ncbi:hypothetical protein B0A48_18723 [Cryoendolithus antarcticus]|uniref:Integrase core domain-containing protein n=1 Tax=Cryoendolithus antarcticus TaxID=1507870 RepID=A0A1V8S7G5_9PEZI|nr:hypothetical protein B0A48_18723 [Cryoendolithus antarcticus]
MRAINLKPYTEQIREWLQEDSLSHNEIIRLLADTHDITVSNRTFRAFLTKHGISTMRRYDADLALTKRIKYLHYEVQCSDDESVFMLTEDGWPISKRRLQRMRLALGLKQRVPGADREQMDALMAEKLAYEMEQGQIEDLGKHHLYRFMRSKYNIIGRERLYAIARTNYSEVIEPRRQKAKRHRGKIIVPGPNYCLSMDGHCKLEKWGIQIYAAIDVYSRHIVWIYIGITGRSQVSVPTQYVAAAAHKGVIPFVIRSDRGAETTLAAAAHWALSKAARTKPDGTPITLDDAFRHGTSKENVSIEMWWNQQTRSMLGRWRQYFESLSNTDQYVGGRLAHRLAFLAVYIPIIRNESLEFVNLWNHHRIRRQKDEHIVHGRPYQLYNYPSQSGGVDCGAYLDAGNTANLSECPRPPSPEQFYRANEPLREAMANLREANVAAGSPLDLDMDHVAFRERDANDEALNAEERTYARLRRELLHHANEIENHDVHAARQQEIYHQIGQAEDQEEVAVLWQELRAIQQELQYANDNENGPENIEGLLIDPGL